MSVPDLLAFLTRNGESQLPAHRLLDAFATASGFDWQNSAAILFGCRLIASPLHGQDIAATRAARVFWNLYEEGRNHYRTLTWNNAIPQLKGDWACFEHDSLETLLPGVVVPTRLKRDHYLTNWLSSGTDFGLDVYAGATMQPLFRHPFPNQFNPLVFGWTRRHSSLLKGCPFGTNREPR